MSAALYTYTGVWINWSEGAIRGATLTLSQTNSGILSAFLAILVSLAGSLFWSILSFTLHQTGTTAPDRRRDALHYQRQVILRNKGAAAAAWALLTLPFETGRTASKFRAVGRSLPLALLPILVLILFGVSGLFTSYITKAAGKSTLIIGPGCGGYSFNATDVTVSNTKSLQDTYDAATYVRRCYQEDANELDCSTYIRPSLPFTTNPNASCPYDPNLCADGGNAALQMDTGLLDSHGDFGINAPPHNRIKYRRVTTCAPVKHGSGLGSVQNDSTWGQIVYINAGYQYYMGEPYLNYTFSYTPIPSVDGVGYTLSAVFAKSDPSGLLNGLESWKPTEAINQTDADITMMMLNQNNINYLQPSYDPWMTALEQQNYSIEGTNVTSSMWTKSYEVNLLVCTDQYQICNPNRPGPDGCTKLGGILSTSLSTFTIDPTKFLGFNVYQIATIGRFVSGNNDRSMYSNVNGRGGAALNASSIAYSNIQFYIPPTQWQTEVTTWFATSLAKEQAWAVEWATAPKNFPATSLLDQSSVGWNVTAPLSSYARVQCTNQLVHNAAGYANFSVLGLALTVGVCGLIILVGLSVDSVVGWLRGNGRWRYMREQWAVEETLNLHRAAYMGLGAEDGAVKEGRLGIGNR
ncbi:hypothetical protein BO82DRAFT_385077 [Aspergillus uvarum CBS 121591]|uniref:Uncharacterized protein n=1 Tax=Aspergillus uvarum CBS 121591 TaxID=1448315 RepID=A0A319DJG4_9EURO|nr:hypothetical protein BO82DRAFT_385077 [Aspergillus uvarum CBS 121591]PYH79582.1 hypothetical protein BO82DRAFT_385077 [Aspergillus uvarum CBS 121591]